MNWADVTEDNKFQVRSEWISYLEKHNEDFQFYIPSTLMPLGDKKEQSRRNNLERDFIKNLTL